MSESDLARRLALRAMQEFAEEHNAEQQDWREIDCGEIVRLIGILGGREFGIGYRKEDSA